MSVVMCRSTERRRGFGVAWDEDGRNSKPSGDTSDNEKLWYVYVNVSVCVCNEIAKRSHYVFVHHR